MIYITGDTHGNFDRVLDFCEKMNTTKEDILIILGDAGINYYNGKKDIKLKEKLKSVPITLFCIHGNHEMRPHNINSYKLVDFLGGKVWVEEEYPNILFAKDGEIFDFEVNGAIYKSIVIGGAYSVDKHNWDIDIVLSHTCPKYYEPVEWFLPLVNQNKVDKSTEIWLDSIFERLNFKKWYCGHYHGSKKIDGFQFMYKDFDSFMI